MSSSRQDEDRMNDFFSGKGRVGVSNVGNTCFVSATVQLLAHVPRFMRAVVKLSRGAKARSDGVTRCLGDMFVAQFLAPSSYSASSAIDPTDLMRALVASPACQAELKSNIMSRRQCDAQELLLQMLESIEREISVPLTNADIDPDLVGAAAADGLTAPLRVFMDRCWLDSHRRMTNALLGPALPSAADPVVHGQLLRETVCGNCKARHPSSDVFSTLTVDLTARETTNCGSTDLATCLRQLFSSESLFGSGWRCDKCKSEPEKAWRTCSLWRCPQVLLVCVKRFDPLDPRHGKQAARVRLARHINLQGVYSGSESVDGSGLCYRLLAVVCHHGVAHFGHYDAYFRDALQDEWFRCDDESVAPCRFSDIDESSSYILAYERFTPRGG